MSPRIVALCALLLASGCSKSLEPVPDKNTNWLRSCERDAECGDAFSCLCGICTRTCGSADECGGDPEASCKPTGAGALDAQCERHEGDAVAVCVASCDGDASCRELLGAASACEQHVCVRLPQSSDDRDGSTPNPSTMPDPDDDDDGDAGPPDAGEAQDADAAPVAPTCETLKDECDACFEGHCVLRLAEHQFGVTMIVDDSQLIWAASEPGAARYSTRVTATAHGSAESSVLAEGQGAYVLAATPEHVYWLQGPEGTSEVRRVARTGGSVETLAGELSWPTALAVDESYVYWADGNDDKVWRLHNDGTGEREELVDNEGRGAVRGGLVLSMLVYDRALYWLQSHYLGQLTLDVERVVHEMTLDGVGNDTLAADASGVYFPGEHRDMPKGQGLWSADGSSWIQPELLGWSDAAQNVTGIALGDEYVYWVYTDNASTVGTLMRSDKTAGGESVVLAQSPDLIDAELALHGDWLYIALSPTALEGGSIIALSPSSLDKP